MNELLRNLSDRPAVRVVLGCGIEHWRMGEITLSVWGDGRVEVQNQRSGKEHIYRKQVDGEQVKAFGKLLAEHHFTEVESRQGTRSRDDVPVWFRIYDGETPLHQADLLHSHRYDNDDLDIILEEYDAWVERITEGQLPYGDVS